MEFAALIVVAFLSYRRLTYQYARKNDIMFDLLIWAIIATFQIITIILMGQRMTTEGKVTAVLIHKRIHASDHADIVSKV